LGSAAHPQRAVDPAALELVLRGRFASSKSSETDYRQALRYFELALEKDPRLAEAYAGIAWTYTFLADAYVTPAIAYTEAERAARKALTIDSTNADAHLVLAMTHIFRDWNFTTAQAEFMRAMALNPQRAEAASTYAVALAWSGRTSEAVAEAERATAIDPLSLIALFQQAMILDIAGRYRDAIGVYRRLIAIEPRFFYLRSFDSWGYRGLGMLDSAYAAARRDVALDNGPVIDLALTLAGMHRTAEARAAIQIAEAGLRKTYYPPEFIALGYAAVDDPDQAFAWLERVFSTRSAFWMQLQYSREWKPMMADARWAAFLKRAEAARQ
jgi:tetratricopeptide (TPR) repeat protein